jgi:hypothetical protein
MEHGSNTIHMGAGNMDHLDGIVMHWMMNSLRPSPLKARIEEALADLVGLSTRNIEYMLEIYATYGAKGSGYGKILSVKY